MMKTEKHGVTMNTNHAKLEKCDHQVVRIFVVDQSGLLRDMFCEFLRCELNALACGVESIDNLVEAGVNECDYLIVNLSFFGKEEVALVRSVLDLGMTEKVIVFSEAQNVYSVAQAFDAGLYGFLSRQMQAASIINALNLMINGDRFLPAPIMKQILGMRSQSPTKSLSINLPNWKPIEVEILTLLQQGKSNIEISSELMISTAAVKSHLTKSYRKLGVKSRVKAVLAAEALGILGPS